MDLFLGETDKTVGGVLSFSPPSRVCIDAQEENKTRINKKFFIYLPKCTINTDISAGLTPLILDA